VLPLVAGLLLHQPAPGPIAQIVSPQPGTKLRAGQSLPVVIRAVRTTFALREWRVVLFSPDAEHEIATGHSEIDRQVVAAIRADDLAPGVRYRITLEAADSQGGRTSAETTLRVPELAYRLIPMEPGNFSRDFFDGRAIDAAGDLIAIGGKVLSNSDILEILHRSSGTWRQLEVRLGSTAGQKLSRDGRRFYFWSSAPAVGRADLSSGFVQIMLIGATQFFSVDRTGRRVAFQRQTTGAETPAGTYQFFLYDELTEETRQLTAAPDAIQLTATSDMCPRLFGTTPLITADGGTVVFLTASTLGLVPEDPAAGCHVFAYDVERAALRHVTGVPRHLVLDSPYLSDDGRWLSFAFIDVSDRPRVSAGLLDMTTGALLDPVGEVELAGFDSAIAGDGNVLVLTSQADLDPRVGNPDHSMEFFAYDLASQEFEQVSETTGGIVPSSGSGCPPFEPAANHDASVIVFGFNFLSGSSCRLAGPQRDEANGLMLGRVRAVRKRPGNRPVVFQPATRARVRAGTEVRLDFSATDPDGDPITFFAQVVGGTDVPPGSSIEDHHNGTATFQWPTKLEHAGLYELRVAAFDEGGGEVFHDVTIAVCSEVADDASAPAVIMGIFSPLAGACTAADRNGDQRVTAADLVRAAAL
jgi:hypothetical protein